MKLFPHIKPIGYGPSETKGDLSEYRAWLIHHPIIDCDPDDLTWVVFDPIAEQLHSAWHKHPVFNVALADVLQKAAEKYFRQRRVALFSDQAELSEAILREDFIKRKSFESFLEKTWRKNVKENRNWPLGPMTGRHTARASWYHPGNWFSKINDVCRTTITVNYLDGIEFLLDEIRKELPRHPSLKRETSVRAAGRLEAYMSGHYAAHVYVSTPMSVRPPGRGKLEIDNAQAEIQITTNLKALLGRLLHRTYEEDRVYSNSSAEPAIEVAGRLFHKSCLSPPTLLPVRIRRPSRFETCDICREPLRSKQRWEWDIESRTFKTNYLGHVVHYLESAMVTERRGWENGRG